MKNLIQVINLGRRSFLDAARTQDYIRQLMIADSNIEQNLGRLLLVEHWPVYTAGLRDTAFTVKDEVKLKSLGADVHRTNRGGLATFHGPGQLVAYPIINLKQHSIGLRRFVELLEHTVIDTCKQLGVESHADRETGVWVEDRKIASIEVNAKHYVTLRGIALNCSTDLAWFDHITPCGLEGVEMTSIKRETGINSTVSEAQIPLIQNFAENFECEVIHHSDYIPLGEPSEQDRIQMSHPIHMVA